MGGGVVKGFILQGFASLYKFPMVKYAFFDHSRGYAGVGWGGVGWGVR